MDFRMFKKRWFAALALVLFASSVGLAQCENGVCQIPPRPRSQDARTALGFARQLSNEGQLRHATNLRGPEVVYYSSARPRGLFWRWRMKRQAIAAWRQSPGHNALLPQIRRVRVAGNYVVGR